MFGKATDLSAYAYHDYSSTDVESQRTCPQQHDFQNECWTRGRSRSGYEYGAQYWEDKGRLTVRAWLSYYSHDQQDLFARKGVYGSWDRLANISAAIDVLDSIQTSMAASLGASYSGTGHKDVDTSDLVWRVARKASELSLNRLQADRHGKPTPDLLVTGEAALKSSSLATFNKKRRELLKGIIEVTEDNADDIAAMDIAVTNETDNV
jgi:hypothetical protein